jgi:hypothetical protein
MAKDFQGRIEDPHAWFIFAEMSFRAAAALWEISDTGRSISSEVLIGRTSLEEAKRIGSAVRMSIPSLLLAGFGFESLLKGILLRQMYFRREPLTTVGKKGQAFLVGSLKSHNLAALAEKARVPLDAEETRLLGRLTVIVTWAGRYPVSIGEDGLVPGAGEYRPTDGKAVIALMRKLFKFANETPELIRVGPAGERIETVQLSSGEWHVHLLSDGKVQREAVGKDSVEIYQTGLDWGRELNRSAKKP